MTLHSLPSNPKPLVTMADYLFTVKWGLSICKPISPYGLGIHKVIPQK